MRKLSSFSRHSFGVRNAGPWRSIVSHTLHQFHENDLFTSAAAMSYFGLLTLFPALLVLLALSNRITAGTGMLAPVILAYPGSAEILWSASRTPSHVTSRQHCTPAVVTSIRRQ